MDDEVAQVYLLLFVEMILVAISISIVMYL